ncbi:MAG: ribbon-helix-helix domain-containing protein [Alphaproteobacteria bacterium]|nr:ribbon-helix-helix domain-containing protein [Alphaproteobacteria bacterium]
MNISLTDEMKAEVDTAVSTRGYVSSSEYIRDLIRKDLEVQRFRALIAEGMDSPDGGAMDRAFFDRMDAEIDRMERG